MPDELIILLVGIVISFLAGLSGGGAGLIILPVLFALGLGSTEAVGAMKMGFIGFVLSSLFSTTARPHVRKDYLRPLIIIVTVTSLAGPLVAIGLDDSQVKFISSTLILITAIASLLTWRMASKTRTVTQMSQYLGYFSYSISGLLVAGFGAGISLISNYILIGLLGMSPLQSVATRRIVGLIAVPLQFIMFALAGEVDYVAGSMLVIGMAIGGLLGLNYAVKKGNEFVKKAMAVASIILVITLFT